MNEVNLVAPKVGEWCERLRKEIHKVIVGLDDVIDKLIMAILCRAHLIFVGVPGLAKTLLVNTLADALDLKFSRIQFTPDLMPSDITGTDILEEDAETGKRYFQFIKGPIFANIVLADEINRTPPKTQSAMLQAMQELKVTASGKTYQLEMPFHVFATQNPIEQDGTYPLPEAQLDRFMMEVIFPYPTFEQESEIVRLTTIENFGEVKKVSRPDEILHFQNVVRNAPVPEHIIEFAVKLVRLTRPNEPGVSDFVKKYVSWGAGPRASQFLVYGAKARALMRGTPVPSVKDVIEIAEPVLRHRIITNFKADADGVTTVDIIRNVLESKELKNII